MTLIDTKWLWIVFILIIILITITIIITKINQPFSFFTAYRVFQKHMNSEVQKPTTVCDFPCRQSSSSPELLGNRTLLKRVQKVMVCDLWLVDLWIHFVCFCVSRFDACDLTSNNDRLQKNRFLFLKIRKKSARRGVPESYAREAREPYSPVGHVRRIVRRHSQSRSPFSASFQTFCFTTRAYFKTPKYGLFCSL